MLSKSDVKFFYIFKNGLYYRPNSCGYTPYIYQAGIYEKKDAIDSARYCREITLLPVDVEKHNQIIKEEIEKLKTNLIEA